MDFDHDLTNNTWWHMMNMLNSIDIHGHFKWQIPRDLINKDGTTNRQWGSIEIGNLLKYTWILVDVVHIIGGTPGR